MGRGNQDRIAFQRALQANGNSLVPPVPEALPTGPTETVRRGWNRTAGSRYAFAADGVTFESSGGI